MNAKSVKTKVRAKVKLVKKHIRDHRELYIGVGVGIAASVIGFMMFSKSFQIAITNPAVINWKPVSNLVQMQMIRPGPKSFVVQCQETHRKNYSCYNENHLDTVIATVFNTINGHCDSWI